MNSPAAKRAFSGICCSNFFDFRVGSDAYAFSMNENFQLLSSWIYLIDNEASWSYPAIRTWSFVRNISSFIGGDYKQLSATTGHSTSAFASVTLMIQFLGIDILDSHLSLPSFILYSHSVYYLHVTQLRPSRLQDRYTGATCMDWVFSYCVCM